MLELTREQHEVLQHGTEAVSAIDPMTNTKYVVIRKDVYERMKELLYDDSPWTDEEMDALAWEAGKHAGWENMDAYDNYPEKP